MKSNNQITSPQATALIASNIIAYSVLSIPRVLSKSVGTPDLWISVIIGGLLTLLSGLLMIKLTKLFPYQTFFEFNKKIVGSFIGSILSLLFIAYTTILSAFEVRGLAEVTQFYLLETTPIPILIISMVWVGMYLVVGGLVPIARLCEFFLPVTLIVFFGVLLMSLKVFHIDNLRPVLGQGIQPVLRGIMSTLPTYSGLEHFLIICGFMKNLKKGKKIIVFGVIFPVILNLFTVLIVIGGLSLERAKTETYPTITLIQEYQYAGIFFERFESFFLAIWIIQLFTTYAISHYIAALGVSQVFKIKVSTSIFIILPLIYLISMIPSNLNNLFRMGTILGYSSLTFSYFLPILLLILFFIRRKING
ncbi:GerAB/ArcD/ProY family transporter [Priestia megaterium]